MTPRRPAPARPGARPGARRTTRTTPRQSPEPQAAPPDVASLSSPDLAADRGEATEHNTVRMVGTDGLAAPTHAISLVVVLLLAFVVTFPSLRGYLSQRARYDAVVSDIARAQATSAALEEELALWQDDDYVKSRARERLAYVMPGETTYVVVGADQFEDAAPSGTTVAGSAEHRPWYDVVRESARVAGGTEAAPTATPTAEPTERGRSTPAPTAPASSGASGPADAAPAGAPTQSSGATP